MRRIAHPANQREQELCHGLPLLLLAVCSAAFSKAGNAQVAAFLSTAHNGLLSNSHLHAATEIKGAENILGLDRKK
jgi:hypothetical protein